MPPRPTTELRHVSVLFCDLVGFTPFSEKRDPEEVREVLSGYFDLARAIVARYGGVVEKFIGDAVMAVWGAPVAKEDDAERAVRAGLELVSAVAAYGAEHADRPSGPGRDRDRRRSHDRDGRGGPRHRRPGEHRGPHPVGRPAGVLLRRRDDAGRPPSAAIAYADAGEHELKGKAEPVRLFQATRVVAAIAGSQRSGVIEAPFIGRDRELRLVKELFHASAERHSARLVLVSGVAGVGKSRLAWEFFKYIDGLAGTVLWHAGRCLSYGEGVSYWALSEMVRARLQIGEEDPPEVVAERLRTGLERWIADAADREFIAPRLGQLLGLPTRKVLAREELFSGWRLFFERLAEHLPVVMVVEDLQWADAGLVDFLDHLLEWSGDHAIFLLVLTRPEGTEREGLVLSRRSSRPSRSTRSRTRSWASCWTASSPACPHGARARIVERADGIPLYAIETVRGLLDKGIVAEGRRRPLAPRRRARRAGDPAGADGPHRLAPRRPRSRRAAARKGVLGARRELSPPGDRGRHRPRPLLARGAVELARAKRGADRPGRQALARTGPVRLHPVAHPIGRLRHVDEGRAQGTAPEDRRAPADRLPRRGCRGGRGDRAPTSTTPTRPPATTLTQTSFGPEAAGAYVQAAERAESVGAPEAAEAAYLKAAELSSDEAEQAGFIEKAGRMAQLRRLGRTCGPRTSRRR